MIDREMSNFNPGNDRVPVLGGEAPCQTEKRELKEVGNHLVLDASGLKRKNGLAIALVVVTVLLPAILDLWTSNQRSTHEARVPESKTPDLILNNKEEQASNPELKAKDPVDQGTQKEPSRNGDLAPGKVSPSGKVHGVNTRTHKQEIMGDNSNVRDAHRDEPTFESTTAPHEIKSTEQPEEIPANSSSTRDTTLGQPQPSFVYEIIHQHAFGGCRGELKLYPSSLAYSPTEGTSHDFVVRPSDITEIELGSSLKIRFANKTYRFKAALASSKEDNRAVLIAIYLQLQKFRAAVHP